MTADRTDNTTINSTAFRGQGLLRLELGLVASEHHPGVVGARTDEPYSIRKGARRLSLTAALANATTEPTTIST